MPGAQRNLVSESGDFSTHLREQVRAAIDAAAPLAIRGGASKRFLGRALQASELDTRPHRGIVHYDPTELVLTARSGTPLAEVEMALIEHGQMLAFEPPHFGAEATFGGMVAAGVSGPRRPWTGSVRDFVLGCRLIDGEARHMRFGGEVMKNVAGYDVARLMAGSFGCLGLLTEISMKVLPVAPCRRTLRLDIDAGEALRLLAQWANRPLPITGACHDGRALYVRLEGGSGSVEASAARIGGTAAEDAFWLALREQQLPFFGGSSPLWRISLPPATPRIDLPGEVLIDWGGAQRWLRSGADAATIRRMAGEAGGHATLWRGDHAEPFHPLTAPAWTLHRRLKAQLDPARVFNPGRMYADL